MTKRFVTCLFGMLFLLAGCGPAVVTVLPVDASTAAPTLTCAGYLLIRTVL